MANLNIRTLYDHYCKESYPLMQSSVTSRSPLHGLYNGLYTSLCSFITHSFILLACLPLLLIKRLPKPLDNYPVVGFYQQQWLDDLDYIDSPLQQVGYAASRVVDGFRIMGNYNPLTRMYKNKIANDCQCECECDGSCSSTTI